MGNGYKMYYVGHDTRRNGVGIVLDPEMKEGVLQVHRESDLSEVMVKIPRTERVWIGADLNGHVGGGSARIWRQHGKFGFGTRNEEGQTILDFVAANNLAVTNTYFKKKDSRKITYTSGGVNSQVALCHMQEK
ncbi:craniofacial development protein 2-like [Penaeus monodon]|uniref:craniofacial development protein 2-like n=1 Tax=Penaeus monodon TaxID=6687 RepID=UPI0018A78CDC|nr:craniofacial development protein 2-like [Penaeus monodon]